MRRNFHENFETKIKIKASSERGLGFVFAAVFAILGFWPIAIGGSIRLWFLAMAVTCLTIALTIPSALRPFNILWFHIGRILNKLANPILLGLIFFLTVTPTAIILKMLGKDLLRLRRTSHESQSYWVNRRPPGPSAESMKKQF